MDSQYPTWTLGYYLNSAELRVQASLHRLLRVFADSNADAFPLIKKILGELDRTDVELEVKRSLEAFLDDGAGADNCPSPLRRVWWRANSIKHNEAHDPSFLARFESRFRDLHDATADLIVMTERLANLREQTPA